MQKLIRIFKMYPFVVLFSTVVVLLVTDTQAQPTVGDSCSEMCRKCEDELEKCTEYQNALTGKINETNQELSARDEALKIVNETLQRKEKCEKPKQGDGTYKIIV